MPRTLITFLGTGEYSETVYQWPGLGEHSTAHVAAALGKLWEANHVVVLATQLAEDSNGASLRESCALASLPNPVLLRLPDGRSEEELWAQFQVIRQAIADASAGEVLIDITHGFRAQPFFAGGVLSLLRAAGAGPSLASPFWPTVNIGSWNPFHPFGTCPSLSKSSTGRRRWVSS